MRKLLVASQKGGVGKTTSSINLATATALAGARVLLLDADPLSSISTTLNLTQHPQRQPLRAAGVDLPGALVSNVLPGLDVLSPYEDSGCSDEDLGRLLRVLATPAVEQSYGCLVVDTPPFLGANPGLLLGTCDEFILVMRAEPLAARTLPAFLELVQRSARGGGPIEMRGILLTLPEGENPGGRWERELRGRFGTRVLPQVVPHDEEVAKALLFGLVVCHANPDSPAASQYHSLVESLKLAAHAKSVGGEGQSGLTPAALLVALALEGASPPRAAARPVAPPPSPALTPVNGTFPTEEPPFRDSPAARPARHPDGEPRRTDPLPEPESPSPPPRRRATPPAPAPVLTPAPIRRRTPPRVPVQSPPVLTPPPEEALPPVVPTAPAAAPAPRASKPAAPEGFPLHLGLFWVTVAVVVGVGLRFLKMPDFVLPILVGLGVAGLVVVLLLYSSAPGRGNAESAGTRRRKGRAGDAKKGRQEERAVAAKRLSGLTRRIGATGQGRPNGGVSEN